MCPHAHWFEEISESTGYVVLGNNQICRIKEIGSVRLKMDDDSVKIIIEVRYIPDVKRNLISLGSIERKGFTFESGRGEMLIKKDGNVLLKGVRRGALYYLDATVIRSGNDEVHITKADSLEIWHLRLGHPAMGSIKELQRKKLYPLLMGQVRLYMKSAFWQNQRSCHTLQVNTPLHLHLTMLIVTYGDLHQ